MLDCSFDQGDNLEVICGVKLPLGELLSHTVRSNGQSDKTLFPVLHRLAQENSIVITQTFVAIQHEVIKEFFELNIVECTPIHQDHEANNTIVGQFNVWHQAEVVTLSQSTCDHLAPSTDQAIRFILRKGHIR